MPLNLLDLPNNLSPEKVYELVCEHDIITSISFGKSIQKRLGKYWQEILNQSILLTTIRNPISRFESEWRYEIQKANVVQLTFQHSPFRRR